jgi:hypothetical protein
MADPFVEESWGVFTGTVGSTAVNAGDLVYFDGTDWELADADDNTKFAEAIATNDFAASDVGVFCLRGIVTDIDAPYTQGDQYYLSATAGATTATRPTGANNLMQVVGFGLSTSQLHMEIRMPHEETHNFNFNAATGDNGQLDSGNLGGARLDAQNEDAFASFMVPQNVVGTEVAYLWLAAEATSGTPTFDMFVSGAIDGEAWDATTQDATIADSAAEGAAADEIQRTTVTTGFDATGVIEAGNLVMVKITKDDGGTDATYFAALSMVWQVV